ncbi:dihydrolipoamide acetyltransferase family protein [Streptomyces sp. SYP-A7185]|uniref:dihydrolipoamide acetyltransferase family protein n=1 Tax=Streptomyces sp. SYP-A7185 TaxID=3040076 RepID=UPI0038F7563D
MAEFTMPSLGADMDEGLLQEWLVHPGDPVHKGDVVAVVETDKAAIEVECFETGTVGRLLVEPGTRVPVGTPLALIEAPGAGAGVGRPDAEPVAAPAAEPAAATMAAPAAEPAAATVAEPVPEPPPAIPEPAPSPPVLVTEPVPTSAADGAASTKPHAKASASTTAKSAVVEAGPLIRHLAAEMGIDLTAVHGTGRGGRITRADIEHAVPATGTRVRATPYARRLAHELGLDLAALRGSGESGAVRAVDVSEAVRLRGESEHSGTAHPLDGESKRPERRPPTPAEPHEDAKAQRAAAMRRAIGDLMSRSKREIPHYYLSTTIDLAAATEWLRRANRGRSPGARLVPAALLLKAAAVAGRDVPQLNGFWQDGGFVPGTGVHLGVAVSLRDGGLLTPVIHDADTLKPEELMAALKDLVQRARQGRLRGSELSGATLTVTSLGDQGVESVFGVIHPPQVALVGFGAVAERPSATGGMLGVRPVVTATLSADHRASDGAIGARYLMAVDRLLQKPEEW